MNVALLTGAPGTAMLAPPLLLSGSSPPPPPSPDAQLHALRRTISTLIERYASLARTQLVPPAFDIFDDFNGGDFRFS